MKSTVRRIELVDDGFGRMSETLPVIYLPRHGETAWSLTGQHTGLTDVPPGGELPDHVGTRADHVVTRVRAIKDDVLIFSSGHFLRVLADRWLGLQPVAGRYFMLNTASVSVLGYENSLSQPVIRLWNDTRHAGN